ncbi:DUF664 domain-containing protein [Epidermidibacterium keratini]|uniref:DUF664 domain-containing protein n=1 Tax=Epidermidibacterium keratini TaxID=1891644 RepID=A0A7L4YNI6_9ACTN|nr:DinB family protein [Epidermidibacterium keratini]QHC00638.1 DUF664 domain-containing protein [Epidermidibacterium keratini]
MTDERPQPPYRGDERETLLGFLRFLRESVAHKCDGLSEEQLRSTPTVSTMSLLGLVNHLADVERWWFQHVFLGRDVAFDWSDEDPDGEWTVDLDRPSADVIAAYRAECSASDEVIAEHDFDALAAKSRSDETRKSLRWIVVHLVEETGRHAGHADILREAIDGSTGE